VAKIRSDWALRLTLLLCGLIRLFRGYASGISRMGLTLRFCSYQHNSIHQLIPLQHHSFYCPQQRSTSFAYVSRKQYPLSADIRLRKPSHCSKKVQYVRTKSVRINCPYYSNVSAFQRQHHHLIDLRMICTSDDVEFRRDVSRITKN
jgi:hypothetical protein